MSRRRSSLLILFGLLVLTACLARPDRPQYTAPTPAAATIVPSSTPPAATVTLILPTPTPVPPSPTPAAAFCQPLVGRIEQACTSPATGLHYWLYLPSAADYPPIARPALLIYLHGFNHSGSDLYLLLTGGLPYEIENGRSLPMVVISPQCPSGENWQSESMINELSVFTTEVTEQFHADAKRVYLTGFSMGGDGVWAVGLSHPEQFAALAPIGSWYRDLANICALQQVPVWVFQGEADEVVSKDYALKISAALQRCGGTVKLTLYPGATHEMSRNLTYRNDELYLWLLLQSR